MLYSLKRHQIPVQAWFDFSLVLTYALPSEILAPHLPEGLELDEFAGHGFVAVALVQTRYLRFAGAPKWLGHDFFLSGYRIFCRYRTAAGRRLRGLRILRSDANSLLMCVGGNLLTHYNYHKVNVITERNQESLTLAVRSADGSGDLRLHANLAADAGLPEGSIFPDVGKARLYEGPLPFTFDFERETQSIIRIEGVRQEWHPRLVKVQVDEITFFEKGPFKLSKPPPLVSAFYVEKINYRWKRGIREKIGKPSNSVDGEEGSSPEPTPGVHLEARSQHARSLSGDIEGLPHRGPYEGVLKIVLFNWPTYFLAGALLAGLLLLSRLLPWRPLRLLTRLAACAGAMMVGHTLLITHLIYDRSQLYRWSWLRELVSQTPTTILNVHAGFDESTEALLALFPNAKIRSLSFYDPKKHTEGSIKRAAKTVCKYPAEKIDSVNWSTATGETDLIVLFFAAHEIRQPDERVAFFREAARSLRAGGTLICVEHLRDLNNFLAFGPGSIHFHTLATWLDAFQRASLTLVEARSLTPFVRVFALRS